jgi:UDP-glucose:(heptosyl)LPS alpha-1,3-glucosyltransferase
MRLGLLARRFNPRGGGTERDLLVSAEFLRRAGHEVMVLAAQVVSAGDLPFLVRRLPAPPGRIPGLLVFGLRAAAEARRQGARLVLSFARTVGSDLLRSGGGAHAAFVRAAARWQDPAQRLAMRLSPYHRLQLWLERRAFAFAGLRKVVAVSNLVRGQLLAEFAPAPDRVVTLYNGVDLDLFNPRRKAAARPALRERLGLAPQAPVAVFAGDGFARKGLGFLLTAWSRLQLPAHLVVAGADRTAGGYRRRARALGIDGRVHFVGRQTEVADLLAGADALVLPSLFEPFGNVVMEAMACGVPALATRQCGVAELMTGELARLVVAEPTDPAELGARIEELLARSREMAACARQAAERHPWERYGGELTRLVAALA